MRYWGRAGTAARYLCLGDYAADGDRYCLGFGGARSTGTSPKSSFGCCPRSGSRPACWRPIISARRTTSGGRLRRQIEQLEYDATRAFEQYNAVDARNRLAATELERRWNAKLEELRARQAGGLDEQRRPVRGRAPRAPRLWGAVGGLWERAACPIELKKQIVRTVIEEALVDEEPPGTLSFIVHWKGGTTAFEMARRTRAVAARPTTIST